MSAAFFLHTPETGDPDDGGRPEVFEYDELPAALEKFLHAVREEEWARLDWSS